jgi:hypothetical protein
MADGLSPNQLHALLKEHGSYDAAVEVRSELAGHLRASQKAAGDISLTVAAIQDAVRNLAPSVAEPVAADLDPDAVRDYEVGIIAAGFSEALAREERPPELAVTAKLRWPTNSPIRAHDTPRG